MQSPYKFHIFAVLSLEPETISPLLSYISELIHPLCPFNVLMQSPFKFHILIVLSPDPDTISPLLSYISVKI